VTSATLLKKVEELSAHVSALETENTRLRSENRLLRQKLDQYIRHYFGSQRNEGLDKQQLELLLQGLPNGIALPTPALAKTKANSLFSDPTKGIRYTT
jgi:regulator of replication initiation timing